MSKSGETILGLIAAILLGGSIASSAVLGTNLKKSNNENEDLRQTNITISVENTNLKESLAEYIAEQKTLKDNLGNCIRTLELANARITQIESELAISNANAESLTSEKATLETQIKTLNSTIIELNTRIAELETEIELLQNPVTVTEYSLQEAGMVAQSKLINTFANKEQANVRIEEVVAKINNGEEVYPGLELAISQQRDGYLILESANDELMFEGGITNLSYGLFLLFYHHALR